MDLLVVALLLWGSAYFAGTELAVTMASRVRLRTRSADGSRLARLAERLLRHPERAIAICLVGNNLVNVALAVYGREALLAAYPMREALADAVATLIIVPLVLLFGEIVPKAVSQNYPNRVLVLSVLPLVAVGVLLAPLLLVAVAVAELVRRAAGIRSRVLEFATREELKQFVARSEKRGHVDADERDLIYQIFEFWKLDARRLVRPLECVPSVTLAAGVGQAKEIMREKRLARLPVTDGSGHQVVGVVSATRLLGAANDTPLEKFMREPVRVELARGLDRLLAELQRSPSQMAVVHGPAGEPGIILLDDLLGRLLARPETALDDHASGKEAG